MCNYQPRAEHMSAGPGWNRNEPRTDRFSNFISCTDLSFIIRRETATHTYWVKNVNVKIIIITR